MVELPDDLLGKDALITDIWEDLDQFYRDALVKHGYSDTIWAEAFKR